MDSVSEIKPIRPSASKERFTEYIGSHIGRDNVEAFMSNLAVGGSPPDLISA